MGKLSIFPNVKAPSLALTPTCASYIAGFVDGEGTITLVKTRRPRNTLGFQFQPTFTIPNSDLSVILSIRHDLGNGRIEMREDANPKHRTVYSLRFTPRQIRLILPQLLPYLRVKKRQCELVMEYLETSQRMTGVRHTPEYVARCSDITKRLRMLNPRGDNMPYHSQLSRDWRDVCETPLIGLRSAELAVDSGDLVTH